LRTKDIRRRDRLRAQAPQVRRRQCVLRFPLELPNSLEVEVSLDMRLLTQMSFCVMPPTSKRRA
jgi:hypothetical protein